MMEYRIVPALFNHDRVVVRYADGSNESIPISGTPNTLSPDQRKPWHHHKCKRCERVYRCNSKHCVNHIEMRACFDCIEEIASREGTDTDRDEP